MKHRGRLRILIEPALSLFFASQVLAQIGELEARNPKTNQPGKAATDGVRYQSANRPDPFINPMRPGKKSEVEEESRGEPPPGIAGTSVEQAVLLGISRKEGARTAVFQGTDRRAYFLHEGDRMFDGYIKKIQDESVLLVRETRLRSGKVLTQEITRTPRGP